MIDDILDNQAKYNEIKNNISKLGITDSSSRIYNILKEMIVSQMLRQQN